MSSVELNFSSDADQKFRFLKRVVRVSFQRLPFCMQYQKSRDFPMSKWSLFFLIASLRSSRKSSGIHSPSPLLDRCVQPAYLLSALRRRAWRWVSSFSLSLLFNGHLALGFLFFMEIHSCTCNSVASSWHLMFYFFERVHHCDFRCAMLSERDKENQFNEGTFGAIQAVGSLTHMHRHHKSLF